MMDPAMQRAREVLDYWLGPPESPGYGEPRAVWFKEGRSIDGEIRERFGPLHEQAAGGALDPWRDDPRACLALILLLDQFPRHMFRGQPRAFATDPQALAAAKGALDAGHDQGRLFVELAFFYLPFAHAEDLAEQRRSVALRGAVPEHADKQRSLGRAVDHLEVIARFGRFPHRNDILARASTPDEQSFLDQNPDAWFAKYRKQPPAGTP